MSLPNRIGYIKGQWVPEAETSVSIYDEWTLYGACLFEMTRSFAGYHFQLYEHLHRLYRGLRELQISEPMSVDDLHELCCEVGQRNDHGIGEEHRLMINVSRGPLGIYQPALPQTGPTLCIADFPLSWTTAGLGKYFDLGLKLKTVSQRQPTDLPMHLKHRSRVHFVLANALVREADTWPLLLGDHGGITECPGANVLWFRGGHWNTPLRHCLEGISAQYVHGLTGELHYHHGPTWASELYDADELIVTATPFCALPVVMLNNRAIGDGTPGPRYKELLEQWSETVHINIKQQIQEWDAQRAELPVSSPYVSAK